ncbi:MAG: HNH endonuclease [Candidatus Woesearchaeota archaeon]|nr:HNH endonuclease [Candidatus Woesearchaeota archaeon]
MTAPLKPQQDPLIYSITITVLSGLFLIYSIYYYTPAITWTIFVFAIGLIASFFIYNTRCPQCKRPFAKEEEKQLKEKLREDIIPYTYYDKIKYLYSDGTVKSIVNDKAHTINERVEVNRHHFKCKKCGYTWLKEKSNNLDENNRPIPIIKTIQTKEKSPLSGSSGPVSVDKYESYPDESTGKSSKVPPLTKYEAEKIIMQRGTRCQYPHCQEKLSLDVHHIVHRSNNGTNKNSNLIVLCPTHHQKADRGEIPATRLKIIVSGSKHH